MPTMSRERRASPTPIRHIPLTSDEMRGRSRSPATTPSSPPSSLMTAGTPHGRTPPSSSLGLAPVPNRFNQTVPSSSTTGRSRSVQLAALAQHVTSNRNNTVAGGSGGESERDIVRGDSFATRSMPERSSRAGAGMGARSHSDFASQVRSSTPPSYARHSLDRSPLPNPNVLDERPRVPPPIYLRSSSPQPQSTKGTLKIHVPGWGVALVRPPRRLELHPLETGVSEPPTEDTVLTGALEVIMKERRRVQAISVGVQSVCRLHMGPQRGWEEDGIFERGVEVLSGDAEGIWLEQGSQSFSFSILLPATLATHDYHTYGRVSYIITARVEGIEDSNGITSLWKSKEIPALDDIPFKSDFDAVIARSDKLAQDLVLQRSGSRDSHMSRRGSMTGNLGGNSGGADGGSSPRVLTPQMATMGLGETSSPPQPDDLAIAMGEGSPTLTGLFHRRQSSDLLPVPSLNLGPGCPYPSSSSPLAQELDTEQRSVISTRSSISGGSRSEGGALDVSGQRTEKNGWLKGDISAMRGLIIHANPSASGGVYELDLRKEGFVAGLGSWRFNVTADVFAIASVMLISVSIPSPAPTCSIFFVRVLLSQSYALHSPRTPNDPPYKPESARNHVLYQVGRPHRHGEKVLGHDVQALWRGKHAGGKDGCSGGGNGGECEGWKTRAMARLPPHDKIRPSTNEGTITPIRVSHDMLLQIFYSIEGETVSGKPIKGPGEVRMCQIRVNVTVPSCCCTTSSLNLPTYQSAASMTISASSATNLTSSTTTTTSSSSGVSAPSIHSGTSPSRSKNRSNSSTTKKPNTTENNDIPTLDHMFDRPNHTAHCMCGASFASLGEAAMRRAQMAEADRGVDGGSGSGGNESDGLGLGGIRTERLGMMRTASARGKEREAREGY